MIKIWGRKSSSNVQVVLWAAAELGIGYDRIDAGLSYGVVDTPAYLVENPNGTVPMIQDGDDTPLWESSAILRYLANSYGNELMWPADPAARAQVDKWMEWAKVNVVLNFTTPIFLRVVRTPPSKQDPVAIKAALQNLNKYLDIAEARLGAFSYLAGRDFTMADIQFGHILYRYYTMEIERADHPNLQRYYKGLCKRPAYREYSMVSYEELRAKD